MLVSLNKNSWHSKYYKWINGFYPSEYYKSVCPYFWVTLVNVIGFPIILSIKVLLFVFEELVGLVLPSKQITSTRKYHLSSWWTKNENKISKVTQKVVNFLGYFWVLYVIGYFIFMVYSTNGLKFTILSLLTLFMVTCFSFFMGVIASNFFDSDSWKMTKAMFHSFKNKTCPRIEWKQNSEK